MYLLIFFRAASLALGQSYDCPSASKVTLKDMGKTNLYQNTQKPQQSMNCMHSSWDIIYCMDTVGLVLVFLSTVELKSGLYSFVFSLVIPWHGCGIVFCFFKGQTRAYLYYVVNISSADDLVARLPAWYPVMQSSFCKWFENWAPLDKILGTKSSKWITDTWLKDRARGLQSQ